MIQDEAPKPVSLHEQALAVSEVAQWFANIGDNPATSLAEFDRWRKALIPAGTTLLWLADNKDLIKEAHARRKAGG